MALVTVNGTHCVRATIRIPRIGVWFADLAVDIANTIFAYSPGRKPRRPRRPTFSPHVARPQAIRLGDRNWELTGVSI